MIAFREGVEEVPFIQEREKVGKPRSHRSGVAQGEQSESQRRRRRGLVRWAGPEGGTVMAITGRSIPIRT